MVSYSSTRAVGTILHKISNGVSSKCSPNSFALSKHGLLNRNLLPSASSISSSTSWISLYEVKYCNYQVRTTRTFSSVCMGRRSCKIAGSKGAQDAKKAKLYSRMGKEVVSAVKKSGPNPISNTHPAAILEKAKELDVPRTFWSTTLREPRRRGSRLTSRKYMSCKRSSEGLWGKMADPGSLLFKFRHARVVNIKVGDVVKDHLLAIALEAGAEDVLEPLVYVDDTDEDVSERCYKVVSSSEDYPAIISKLHEDGIKFETDNGSELLPIITTEVDDEAMELKREFMYKLLELDDVDAVYRPEAIKFVSSASISAIELKF